MAEYLGVSVVRLLELQVLPSFAGQVEPLSLQPLHDGLPAQHRRVDFGHKRDVLPCQQQRRRTFLFQTDKQFVLLKSGHL